MNEANPCLIYLEVCFDEFFKLCGEIYAKLFFFKTHSQLHKKVPEKFSATQILRFF
jgi:hypothetical protein